MGDILDISSPAIVIKSWVEQYSDGLYSWALYKTNSKETAEDLVQESFLSAFQAIHKFEGKSEPKTWLFGILNNKIAEHFRKVYRNPDRHSNPGENGDGSAFFESFFSPDGHWSNEQRPRDWAEEQGNLLDDAEFIMVLQSCMGKLPPTGWAAVQLKYLEQKKGELICQELQIAPTNFWQILHRTKLQLRKCLELNWFKK